MCCCSCRRRCQVDLPYSNLLYLVFLPIILTTVERRVLKSPTLNVELCISPFSFVSFCFMYFVFLLHLYILRIFILSCCIHFSIIMKCPSVSLVSLFVLQYIFTDIIIVTLTFLCLFSMEENHPTSCCHYWKMQLF